MILAPDWAAVMIFAAEVELDGRTVTLQAGDASGTRSLEFVSHGAALGWLRIEHYGEPVQLLPPTRVFRVWLTEPKGRS